MIGPDTIPSLPRGVRVQSDRVRGCTVLLGPERVLIIDPIGEAILSRLDGMASVSAICNSLAENFAAPREVIEPDVIAYLQDLGDKRLVDMGHG